MSEHLCDKGLIIEQHGRDIAALFSEKNDLDGRLTEVETTLYGAARNGGGFIKETKETLEVVRLGVATMSGQIKELSERKQSRTSMLVASLPALVAAGATIATVLLTR